MNPNKLSKAISMALGLSGAVGLLVSGSVYSATIVSDQNGDWATAANWNTNTVPTASDLAQVNNGFTIGHATGIHSVNALQVNSSFNNVLNVTGGSLTALAGTGNGISTGTTSGVQVNVSGGTLAATGTFLNQRNVTVSGTGTLTAGTYNQNQAGTGVPITNVTGGTFSATTVNNTATSAQINISGTGGFTAGTLTNSKAVSVNGGSFTVNNTLAQQTGGTLTINNGASNSVGTLAISGGTTNLTNGNIAATTLNITGANTLNGSGNIVVNSSYANTAFGTGNTFNARANITGVGNIIAGGDAKQGLTGADIGGTTNSNATLAFGNVHVGDNVTKNYQVTNTGTTGPSILGAIQTTTAGANINDARLSGSGLTAGNYGTLATGATTANQAVTFNATSTGALTGQSVKVVDNFGDSQILSITGAAYQLASASALSPSINFGNVHVGDAANQNLSLTNSAANTGGFTENLDANASTSGNATGTGASSIAAQGSSNVNVGIDTSTAGAKSGTVTFNMVSNGAGTSELGTTSVGSQNVGVSGGVYQLASASTLSSPVNLGIIHAGGTTTSQNVALQNTAADTGGFTEKLRADFASATGDATGTGSTLIAAQASGNVSVSATDTSLTAGNKTGSVTFGMFSDGTGTSGLADTSLGNQTVNVNYAVYDYASVGLSQQSGSGTFSSLGPNYQLNFGSVLDNSGTYTATLRLINDGGLNGFTDDLAGLIVTTSLGSFSYVGASSFTDIDGGGGVGEFVDLVLSFNTTALGVGAYAGSILLDQLLGYNTSGYSGGLSDITININGVILGEPVVVPVPATMWLFSSIGFLLMFARRKQLA